VAGCGLPINIIVEYNGNTLVWNYCYSLGQRIEQSGPNNADFTKQIYHNNHLGNGRAMANRNGDVVTSIDYYPFDGQLQLIGQHNRFSLNNKERDDGYGFDFYY
jgi:hypothetical protein